MLYFEEKEVEAIAASEKVVCSICAQRRSSWMASLLEEEDRVPVCGWCLLYSGKTEWGYRNRDELVHVGMAARDMGLRNRRPSTHIPELDGRHRLQPKDAESFVAGVYATSRSLRGPLSRFVRTTGKGDS